MKVFVVNCGSSSIKYQLFDMSDESVLAKGLLERVGTEDAVLHLASGGRDHPQQPVGLAGGGDHWVGLKTIVANLIEKGVIDSVEQIQGAGHRVVHGGEAMNHAAVIDADVLKVIKDNCPLAPLHNPANLAGIEAAREVMPSIPQVAVFDTAFLADLPAKAYRYAVPEAWYRDHHVRKYGFHGTSHQYVTLRMAELLGTAPDQVNLITVHLGNGCSITAVAGGKAVDHSMGLTPLEGLIMGTRSGDLDPAVIFHMASTGMDYDQILHALNKESGLLGVSGHSNDMRDLLDAIEAGDQKAALAVEMFIHRIVKYIGAYYTILPSVDAVVLTGGIGENCSSVREDLCRQLSRLGAALDPDRNAQAVGGQAGPITADGSALAVWVVPTNEELMIARDTKTASQDAR